LLDADGSQTAASYSLGRQSGRTKCKLVPWFCGDTTDSTLLELIVALRSVVGAELEPTVSAFRVPAA